MSARPDLARLPEAELDLLISRSLDGDLSPEEAQELQAYLAAEGEAALGSVGCYRLEGQGVQLFSAIEGDYFAILGLPLTNLLEFLRRQGVLTT